MYWNPFLFCVAEKLKNDLKKEIKFLPIGPYDQNSERDFEDEGLEIEKGVYLHGDDTGWRISSSPNDSAQCSEELIKRFKDKNDLAPLFNNDDVASSDDEKGIIVLRGEDKDVDFKIDGWDETCRFYDKVDRIDYIVKFFKNRVS
ncbi:hypothetical protein BBC0178_007930 [Bartonella apihabitans]|uniref:Uncharacterized protein n=1 Tax=Bartonella apihabitans TaxID=2750929 RepID=A0A1U9MAE8_9HYPH|nr:hypothetical protein BBC0178_007930 [Bartonella apihabitans]